MFSKPVENTVGKGEIAHYEHSVFKNITFQTRKNQGLFGKGLKHINIPKKHRF